MKKEPFDIIILDVDSTLSTIEGIDWIAKSKGKYEEASALTELAMNGKVKMEEVFGKKIDLVAPSHDEFMVLGKKYIESLSDNAHEVIDVLHKLGKEVWLVTGNFYPSIEILAKHLTIPKERIVANPVYFDEKGNYKDFDRTSPLARSGGKAEVVQKIKKKGKKIAFIGDSVTDLDTQPYVDLFIGFGGVVTRAIVLENAHVFVKEKSFLSLLPILLTDEERVNVRKKADKSGDIV